MSQTQKGSSKDAQEDAPVEAKDLRNEELDSQVDDTLAAIDDVLDEDTDDLLDDLDDLLEENAEQFVNDYVQQGGQ